MSEQTITVTLTIEEVKDIMFALDAVRFRYECEAARTDVPKEMQSRWLGKAAHFGLSQSAFTLKCFPVEVEKEEGEC